MCALANDMHVYDEVQSSSNVLCDEVRNHLHNSRLIRLDFDWFPPYPFEFCLVFDSYAVFCLVPALSVWILLGSRLIRIIVSPTPPKPRGPLENTFTLTTRRVGNNYSGLSSQILVACQARGGAGPSLAPLSKHSN